ncbi:hypothetical protein MMC30_002630 [Trapelia coarctata]|nr:hypothetical protein [Trapelia coarctata]
MSSQAVTLSGFMPSQNKMPAIADLRNETLFPNFGSCPSEYDVDLGYYHTLDGLYWIPTRHWCLLAEIVEAFIFIRLRLVAKDKDGHKFVIAFYLEPDDTGLRPSDFREGHTVAILYPHQHGFLDLTEGIRQEDIKRIQVIPLSVADVLALSDRVQEQNRPVDGKFACHACGARRESLVVAQEKHLGTNGTQDCQEKGWKEMGHKKDCKVLKDIKGFFTMKWDTFEEFTEFPL